MNTTGGGGAESYGAFMDSDRDRGSNGGGVVYIQVHGKAYIDGVITTNGERNALKRGGRGSGGSICIEMVQHCIDVTSTGVLSSTCPSKHDKHDLDHNNGDIVVRFHKCVFVQISDLLKRHCKPLPRIVRDYVHPGRAK